MRKRTLGILGRAVKAIVSGLVGALVVLLIAAVLYLNNRPDLKVWHEADLDAEFTEDSEVHSFTEYLALEERLFAQLQERVYAQIEPGDKHNLNRYNSGSWSDPARWPTNWNRSFELTSDAHARVYCCCTACRIRPTACTIWVSDCRRQAPRCSAYGSRVMVRRRWD
jgi:hypothetical protein